MPAPWGGAVGGAAESVSLLTLLLFLPETTQHNAMQTAAQPLATVLA